MKVSAAIEKPEEVNVTMTITLAVSDWRQLKSMLSRAPWPGWKLGEMIRSSIDRIETEVLAPMDLLPDLPGQDGRQIPMFGGAPPEPVETSEPPADAPRNAPRRRGRKATPVAVAAQ